MPQTEHMPYTLMNGSYPVLPRPGFAFQRLPQKIFFIGFNKTATSALHLFMMCSGVRAIHSSGNGKLFGRTSAQRAAIPHVTKHMADNIAAQRDPLLGLDEFDCFVDLTVGPHDLCRDFKSLHVAYPDAFFILNTRDKDRWLTSRTQHGKSVKAAAEHYDIPRDAVRALWSQHYDDHHAAVRTHFAIQKNGHFLEWDITTNPAPLITFLNSAGVMADPAHLFRIRETKGDYFPPPLNVRVHPQDVPILPL